LALDRSNWQMVSRYWTPKGIDPLANEDCRQYDRLLASYMSSDCLSGTLCIVALTVGAGG